MVNFEDLLEIHLLHDQLHTYRIRNLFRLHIDPSCKDCYPEHLLEDPTRFDNFWNWFSAVYPAIEYSGNTQRYLYRLINAREPQQILEQIEFIVISIRYSANPGEYDTVRQDIYNIFILTEGFLRDPFEEAY